MRPMMLAFAAIAVVTVGAWFGLGELGFSAADRQSGDAVRLD